MNGVGIDDDAWPGWTWVVVFAPESPTGEAHALPIPESWTLDVALTAACGLTVYVRSDDEPGSEDNRCAGCIAVVDGPQGDP